MAHSNGRECYSLSFDYGQRHRAELNAARGLAERYGDVIHRVVSLDLSAIGGSALTDMDIPVPTTPQEGIPITYVPARNTVFLSLALGWAEVLGASEIYIGVNAVDYSGYPDCRPEFIAAYQQLIGVATKAGVEGASISLETPLMDLSKGAIIDAGLRLGVDYSLTVSCYQADEMGRACGECDSCRLRAAGFEQAGVPDPTRYR
jgi:7-cyano-7-deazaguanine synthase